MSSQITIICIEIILNDNLYHLVKWVPSTEHSPQFRPHHQHLWTFGDFQCDDHAENENDADGVNDGDAY